MSDPNSNLNPALVSTCGDTLTCAHIDLRNDFSAVAGRLATEEQMVIVRRERAVQADETVVVIATKALQGTGIDLGNGLSAVVGVLANNNQIAAVRKVYDLPDHEKVVIVSNAAINYAPALAA